MAHEVVDYGLCKYSWVCKDVNRYYLPVMYGTIFIAGLVRNVTSICIYILKLWPWSSSSIVMVNLAMADLFYVTSLPFLGHYYATRVWTTGEVMYKMIRMGFHLNLYGSILLLTCFSVFRYKAVRHPFQANKFQRRHWGIKACLVVWMISLMEISPMLHMIKLETDVEHNSTQCIDFASNHPAETVLWCSCLLTVLGYLLPLVVVCRSYASIGMALARESLLERRCRVRVRRLTVLILVMFVLCFMPYHILRALRVYTRLKPVPCWLAVGINAVYILSRPLAGLNTFFNLALYTLAGEGFQKALLGPVLWKHSSSKINRLILVSMIEMFPLQHSKL